MTPRRTIEQTRLLAEKISSGAVETWHKLHTIHIGSRQLWREIHKKIRRWTSKICHWTRLHSHGRLDRKPIHWNNPRLGLQTTTSPPVNAQLRKKRHWNCSNKKYENNNMHHTHAHQLYTELRYNTQSLQYNHHWWMSKQRSSSNKCVGSSSS